MSTRALCTCTPSRSSTEAQGPTRVDAQAASAPAPALPKAAVARLARLDTADMPWLGQDGRAMLAGYDGPERGGPAEYPTESAKQWR